MQCSVLCRAILCGTVRGTVVVFTILLCLSGTVVADSLPIKIGALLCLSGECAEPGQNALRGIELASKEINAQGGVLGRKIEVVSQG